MIVTHSVLMHYYSTVQNSYLFVYFLFISIYIELGSLELVKCNGRRGIFLDEAWIYHNFHLYQTNVNERYKEKITSTLFD